MTQTNEAGTVATVGARQSAPDHCPSPIDLRQRRHVRLFFGSHVIAEYWADPERAAHFAEVIGSRFGGLRVENIAAPVDPGQVAALPEERLWNLPPH